MNQSNDEKIVEEVRNIIFVDQKIVTFNFISKQYNLTIPQAKEILNHVVNELKNEGRSDFITSHYITGYSKDSNPDAERGDEDFLRYNVMEADNDELEEHKETFFSRVDNIVLRSIRSCEINRDRDLYAKPDDQPRQPVITCENGGKEKESTKKERINNVRPMKSTNFESKDKVRKVDKEGTVEKKEKVETREKEEKKDKIVPKAPEKLLEKASNNLPERKQVPDNKVKKESLGEESDTKPVKQQQQENDLKRKSVSDEANAKPTVKKSKNDKNPPPQQKRITDFFRR